MTCAQLTSYGGFAALKPILQAEGVYRNLCGQDDDDTCEAQDTRLNLLFTVASSATNVRELSRLILES